MSKKTIITVLVLLILFLSLFASSCKVPSHLHNTGTYKIKERKGNETTFEGIAGKYLVLSDTLKPGDKIHINVIHRIYYKSKN